MSNNIFFISDLHLNHANILKLQPHTRPYATVQDMNADLIDKWNSVVGNNDLIYFLGDFCFKSKNGENHKFFRALKGKKVLVPGNHDHTETRNLPWHDVQYYLRLKLDAHKVILFHYPISVGQWDGAHHGSIHLFGHVHGAPQYSVPVRAFDVGVDAIGPTPISWDTVKADALAIPVVVKHHADEDTR